MGSDLQRSFAIIWFGALCEAPVRHIPADRDLEDGDAGGASHGGSSDDESEASGSHEADSAQSLLSEADADLEAMDAEEEACEDGAEWSDGQPMFPDSQPILEDNVGPKDHGEVPRPVARPLAAEFDHARSAGSQPELVDICSDAESVADPAREAEAIREELRRMQAFLDESEKSLFLFL